MKTFDIALEYLNGTDFTNANLYNDDPLNKELQNIIDKQLEKYKSDSRNTCSNDYYRSMVFACCIYHCIDLAQGNASYWNVACEIIEANKDILETEFEGFTKGSDYPKIMMDKFIEYCNNRKPQPSFLNEESEVRVEFFMAAFHYITEDNS